MDSGWHFSCSNIRKRLRKDSISFTFNNSAQVAPSASVSAETGVATRQRRAESEQQQIRQQP